MDGQIAYTWQIEKNGTYLHLEGKWIRRVGKRCITFGGKRLRSFRIGVARGSTCGYVVVQQFHVHNLVTIKQELLNSIMLYCNDSPTDQMRRRHGRTWPLKYLGHTAFQWRDEEIFERPVNFISIDGWVVHVTHENQSVA